MVLGECSPDGAFADPFKQEKKRWNTHKICWRFLLERRETKKGGKKKRRGYLQQFTKCVCVWKNPTGCWGSRKNLPPTPSGIQHVAVNVTSRTRLERCWKRAGIGAVEECVGGGRAWSAWHQRDGWMALLESSAVHPASCSKWSQAAGWCRLILKLICSRMWWKFSAALWREPSLLVPEFFVPYLCIRCRVCFRYLDSYELEFAVMQKQQQ